MSSGRDFEEPSGGLSGAAERPEPPETDASPGPRKEALKPEKPDAPPAPVKKAPRPKKTGAPPKPDAPPQPDDAPPKPARKPSKRKKPDAPREADAPAAPAVPSEADAAAAFDAAVEEENRQWLKPEPPEPERPFFKKIKAEPLRAPHRPGPPSWWTATVKFLRVYTKTDTVSGLALRLFVITAAAALLLSAGNALTGARIGERETAARDEAMRRVIGADEFLPTGDKNIYLARLGGHTVGYAVLASPNGYGGPIRLIVGISPDFKLIGVSLLSMSETPGYGARLQTEPEFLAQFAERSLPLNYGENGLDALSGATVTSGAVLGGVRDAIRYTIDYVTGGME
ncbi:MAG: FMN-binding protein [Oscillospiraceae bacterium]|nr:FMN-binding protein [Oscillospiraceae bacterium]